MLLRRGIVWCAVVFAACGGDTGPEGPGGADGMMGSQGDPGPIAEPPVLASLAPRWGSANTQVTITGTGFSTTAADNQVFFDGQPATVVSATATQLVVTPGIATDDVQDVVVDVEVANQVSNGLLFELVAPGTARHLGVPLPSAPTGVAVVGTDIYIASGVNGVSRTGGLFKVSNGVVTQVVRGELVTVVPNGTPIEIIDGPVAVTSFNGDVYYTTTFGAVRKYTVATGVVTDVLVVGDFPGGGNQFPQRTGLAFDSAGNLYMLDRSVPAIIRMDTTGTLTPITNAGFPGIYGLASDGTDLFVSDEVDNAVYRVTTPGGTPAVNLVATGSLPLRGITTAAANVIVSTSTGVLLTVPKTTSAGAFTLLPASDAGGYLYEATGLARIGNDTLMAQPAGGVVRRKPAADADATIIAAGVRLALAATTISGNWYLGTIGNDVFNGGPSATQPDGAILEITPTSSRVLATTFSPLGLVASGATAITISDCLDGRIFAMDTTSLVQTDLVASFSGTCPLGLTADATAVYYVESDGSVGKIVGTTDTPDFVTGLDVDASQIAIAGGKIVTSGLFDPAPVQQAPVTTGGAATVLTPQAVFSTGTLAAAADGTLFGMRSFSGELVEIDPASGVVTPLGSAIPPERPVGPSMTGALLVGADKTITLMDLLQGDLVSIAP